MKRDLPPAFRSMPADPSSSRLKTFLRRSGSTAGLWLLIGAALVFAHPLLFYALLILIVVLALLEYFQLLSLKNAKWEAALTIVVAAAYCSAAFWQAKIDRNDMYWGVYDGVAISAIVFIGFLIHLIFPVKPGRSHVAVMACVFGFIYVPYLFGFCTRIIFFDDGTQASAPCPGSNYLLFLLATTKFTDMGAYVVGSMIGKRKMIPHVSPGKTWEGTIGAFVFTLIAGYGVTWLVGGSTSLLTPVHTFVLCFLVFLGAILGDLAESVLKRSLAMKDSGHVMPGIGGVLDLIDSVIFTAPIVYFYLLWLNH